MLENYTDIELLELTGRKGSKNASGDAFKELFRRYSKKIYFYCRKFLDNNVLAEDAVQEVFLKLLNYVKSGNQITNVNAFLFMAARNQCINMKKIENRYDTFIDEQNTFFTENLQESKELAKLIDSALELLPEDHKDAFCLQMYLGMSYGEIAEIRNVPVSTVRNWIVRAKLKLRKILTPYFEELG